MNDATETASARLEQALAERDARRYVLRLYVAGQTPRSTNAILAVKAFCEELLPGRYELEVIDLYQQPERAVEGNVVFAPTLIKRLPLPLRRLVGDLSQRDQVLLSLDLRSSP